MLHFPCELLIRSRAEPSATAFSLPGATGVLKPRGLHPSRAARKLRLFVSRRARVFPNDGFDRPHCSVRQDATGDYHVKPTGACSLNIGLLKAMTQGVQ